MRHMQCFPTGKCVFLRVLTAGLALIFSLLCLYTSLAQGADIARDLANPFSSLWNIVNQLNWNQLKGGYFNETHTQFNWNLQPVMPVPLNQYFNVVNRPVIPYYQNPYLDLNGVVEYASGMGDIQLASLLSPNKAEGIIYGLGVTMIAPTPKDSFPV